MKNQRKPQSPFCSGGTAPCFDPAPAYRALIGIDWADQKHVYCIRSLSEECGPKFTEGHFTNEGFADWILALRKRFGPGKIAIALEDCRSALIYALSEHAEFIDIYAIAPAAAASYRESFRPSGAKSDPPDAQALMDQLYRHADQYRRWQPDDAATRLLDALCRNRRGAVDARTALGNELLCRLKFCYPVAVGLTDELTCPMMLQLLQRWPTQQQLQAAKPATLQKFFYLHGVRTKESLTEKLARIAAAAPMLHDEAVLLPAQLEVARLVAQLSTLAGSIKDYDSRIAKLYQAHPDAFIFASLPGAGKVLGPRLLCAMGSCRERWPNALHLQTFSGLAPVRKASGNTLITFARPACPRYLRQSFHEFAASSIKFCPWAHDLHQRLMGKGKSHHTAVRAVAFRWVRILWRMWKDRVPYAESVYLAARQVHAIKAQPQQPVQRENECA